MLQCEEKKYYFNSFNHLNLRIFAITFLFKKMENIKSLVYDPY